MPAGVKRTNRLQQNLLSRYLYMEPVQALTTFFSKITYNQYEKSTPFNKLIANFKVVLFIIRLKKKAKTQKC